VNGHGGNTSFLQYFCQAQLASRRDYALLLFAPSRDPEADAQVKKLRKTPMDMHAGETETSTILAHRPDLAHAERAKDQSGEDQGRLASLRDAYTGIWWYARFPNHYAGDGSPASAQLGELLINSQVEQLVQLLKQVKQDTKILELQQRFFDEAAQPLKTPQ
jgi:creatinine amidohydrolase